MTGFGSGEAASVRWTVTVELTGVNRKQRDIATSLPQSLSSVEPEIRDRISRRISRGRINARVCVEDRSGRTQVLVLDRELARQYAEYARELAAAQGLETRLDAGDFIRAPGVFRLEEVELSAGEIGGEVLSALDTALGRLEQMQREEGKHLRSDMERRLDAIERQVAEISGLAREVVTQYRETLFGRLTDCGLAIDLKDERVLREIALYAERCDITEELTRIESHVGQFRRYLESEEPVGRPLDFLCQELNRELNTIGSKANHARISQAVVDSKSELEKIREQVQNVQ